MARTRVLRLHFVTLLTLGLLLSLVLVVVGAGSLGASNGPAES